jgi:hypothetical protein
MTDRLHKIAQEGILSDKSEQLTFFGITFISHTTADAKVAVFGKERWIPPTTVRKLGPRLVQISEIKFPTSSMPHVSNCSVVPDDHVTVTGMSCHVPGVSDLSVFWEVLASGQSQYIEMTSLRFGTKTLWREVEKGRKRYGDFMGNYDTFDHKLFKKSPREMDLTNPQHGVILQLAYQAVEHSLAILEF